MASTSNPHISYNYDVFLSFRGKDTRNTFTDHLYASLIAHGIHTFRDDEELEKGGDIASDLQRAIEESKIFIVIFSTDYAESKWCLNELVKIIDCKTKKGSMVWPVFYHVDPRDVRNQGGSFGEAFLRHAKDADEEKEKTIEMWKEALKTAGKLSGHHLENQSKAELVRKIREAVIAKLNRKPLHVGDNIIGMDFHLEQLKPLIRTELDEVHMVGIFGTSGIGKTTISIAIYNHISSQFNGSSFLKNVGGQSEAGLVELQKTILQDILKCNKPEFNNINEGINVMKERLQSKRVLIVLDDVDEYTQLESLGRKHGCYGANSVIIITTKNQHLLDQHEVKARYGVRKLDDKQSTKIFNWWAFKQNTPTIDFKSLSKSVVKYADGLPIALKVLGGLFCNISDIGEWESQLNQLREIPDMTIQKVLKVSYDKLGPMEREIFLDIACFFRGENKEFVLRILGSKALNGIRVLRLRCLITISENKLDMHDLLQQMGREIVREECPDEAGERSRLWDPTDVQSVLTRNLGTKMIKGLFIDGSALHHHLQFSRDSFTRMNKLRFLKVYTRFWTNFKVDLPMDFELSSYELTYLHFQNYPLESLPKNLKTHNLVELNLQSSKINRLWKENEVLHNLKVINLNYSKDLVQIPDCASVPNLEILMLYGCSSLESLPRNFDKLQHLQSLNCAACSKLKSFPQIQGNMSKLRQINLKDTAIVEVPSSIALLDGLEYFYLSETAIKELPSSIGHLKDLQSLKLSGCRNLENLPDSICNLRSLEILDLSVTAIKGLPSSIGHLKALQTLDLSDCISLVNLPDSISGLRSLKILDLSATAIKELPSSIGHLKALQSLKLSGCRKLKNLPDSICNLRSLEILDLSVTAIKGLSSSIGHLKALQTLDLSDCINLVSLPDSICGLRSLEILDLSVTTIKELPYSVEHLKALQSLKLSSCRNLENLPDSICNLRSLEILDLSITAIKGLPSSIGHLKALQTLDLSNCINLVNLPDSICGLRSLEILDLSVTAIKELPSSIGHLKALQSLKLSSCRNFENLPDSICNLRSLEILDLSETAIKGLPSSIGHLKALQTLDLSDCINLVNLPDSICGLRSLEILDLSVTTIKELPFSIGQLKALQSLKLLGCRNFENLPDSIFNLRSLEILDLSVTTIKGLPSSIGHLKALQTLDLSDCINLVNLPDSICGLRSLEILNLSVTAIKELPFSIGHLKALQSLKLSGCRNLENLPDSICNLRSLEILDLSVTAIKELPSSIGHLNALQSLKLSDCRNLENLPDSICDLRSLEILSEGGCSKLERLEVKPNENEWLTCDILKPGVVWPYDRFSSLKKLNIEHCNQMEAEAPNSNYHQRHLLSLSSLVELSVRNSTFYGHNVISTDGFHLSSLEVLSVGNFNPTTRGILWDIFHQSSL